MGELKKRAKATDEKHYDKYWLDVLARSHGKKAFLWYQYVWVEHIEMTDLIIYMQIANSKKLSA